MKFVMEMVLRLLLIKLSLLLVFLTPQAVCSASNFDENVTTPSLIWFRPTTAPRTPAPGTSAPRTVLPPVQYIWATEQPGEQPRPFYNFPPTKPQHLPYIPQLFQAPQFSQMAFMPPVPQFCELQTPQLGRSEPVAPFSHQSLVPEKLPELKTEDQKSAQQKEKKPAAPCRCGSTTHKRTNHHRCPLNPDTRWKLTK